MNIRHIVGVVALALVVLGVYGLAGWAWAAIAAGAPAAVFYLWGEAQAVRTPEGSN